MQISFLGLNNLALLISRMGIQSLESIPAVARRKTVAAFSVIIIKLNYLKLCIVRACEPRVISYFFTLHNKFIVLNYMFKKKKIQTNCVTRVKLFFLELNSKKKKFTLSFLVLVP